jgi:hypothetical protein
MKEMTKSVLMSAALLTAAVFSAQGQSPSATTSATIGGKQLTIKYNAPSVRGRQIFGEGGIVSHDPTYPVWRAGANSATAFHTDADLDIKGLKVPAGDYTIFVQVTPEPWQLIINKQTKQWGLAYDKSQDLGRVPMDVAKPSAPIETMKITLSSTGAKTGKLQIEWDKYLASAPITAK